MLLTSVVRYLQYIDKYREYQRFDTSIEEILVYRGPSRRPNTTKYCEMCDDTVQFKTL